MRPTIFIKKNTYIYCTLRIPNNFPNVFGLRKYIVISASGRPQSLSTWRLCFIQIIRVDQLTQLGASKRKQERQKKKKVKKAWLTNINHFLSCLVMLYDLIAA
jgi:hypothetical protein